MTLPSIDPKSLQRRLEDGSAVLIDVREPSEFARERILGARSLPLSQLDHQDIAGDAGKAVVFCCRTGNRTTVNAAKLSAKTSADSFELLGGIEAWKAAGLPIRREVGAPIELMRQVQIGAGSLVLLGLLLAIWLSPWFLALSAFVGAGLVVAGATGFCGMARMLEIMPWNRRAVVA